ncbi:TIGR04219 family outer membrane beta-barrel protein [Marinimicrobium alkaliphilum]|uniref:TIGR04219 family outer membrane beta-barrel protein n=1 Tax=Marinimicrobium alkaliphilum TaxID=2202654 RepID=UPI000DBA39B9|nr:TIGR04219 family outer membrane beta-barrel protein [Marinimicrobium alkaliphilum]
MTMKKLALATSLLATAPLASADFLALYGGAGIWQTEFSGDLGTSDTSIEGLGYDDTNNGYFYVGVEHFLPLIPNARIQRTNINDTSTAVLTSNFTLNNETFQAGTEVATELDLSHTDVVIYYELLDNIVELDLGVALRKFGGYASAASVDVNQDERVDIDAWIPLAYAGAQVNLPMSGFYAGLDLYMISAGDNKISDYAAKVGYTFDFVAVDFGLELGYRDLTVEYDEDTQADASFKGAYLGATIRF